MIWVRESGIERQELGNSELFAELCFYYLKRIEEVRSVDVTWPPKVGWRVIREAKSFFLFQEFKLRHYFLC